MGVLVWMRTPLAKIVAVKSDPQLSPYNMGK